MKKISSALISVFDKNKIENICHILSNNDIEIYSTGGTFDYIKQLGIKIRQSDWINWVEKDYLPKK